MAADQSTMSAEYHEAHLAWARAGIVEAAAYRGALLDRLKKYTDDVRRAERDRIADLLREHYRENTVCSDFAKAIKIIESAP
jgi:hypothetical protein